MTVARDASLACEIMISGGALSYDNIRILRLSNIKQSASSKICSVTVSERKGKKGVY